MRNMLIVLRGPSGAGKTTIAKRLQALNPGGTLVISQDYYRHELLDSREDRHGIVPELVRHNSLTALQAGYTVILEGIFRKEKYLPMFEQLRHGFAGPTYIYYFDIPFEETARRHAGRDKSQLFSAEDMKAWYHMAAPLGLPGERRITPTMHEAEIIALVRRQTGL